MIHQLSRDEQDRLHHRYRNSDLFRHWSPLLHQLEFEQNEVDVLTLWYQMELVLDKLRRTDENRDEMIPYLFIKLREDFKTLQLESGATVARTDILAELSAVTVMCVMMTQLLNAVQPGHEEEVDYDNFPICVAITNLLRNHPHFQLMMNRFFKKKKDNRGKEIVITPADPMKMDEVIEQMDDSITKGTDDMVENLRTLTAGLKQPFGELWDDWCKFCHEVCQNQEFLTLLYKVEPKRNEWGVNQKMVCNMVGLFNHEKGLNLSLRKLNSALSEKQLRTYIANYADFKNSDTALTKKQHEIMKMMLVENG